MYTSKITSLPIPRWLSLLKILSISTIDEDEFIRIWKSDITDSHFWFSRSAFAMLAIAQWWKINNDEKLPNIWVPDYFCNQSLQLLRDENFPIYFYPINENLMPDWEKCKIQAKTTIPDIFILVHYFGLPSDLDQAKIFCDEFQCVFVEDAAHVLKPEKGIGKQGDFIFYSPYKLLPIPAGSLLIERIKSTKILKLSNQNNVVSIQDVIQKMPNKAPSSCIWLLKRISQKLLPNFIFRVLKKYFNTKESITSEIPFKPKLNWFGKRLLFTESKNIERITVKRQINYSLFYNLSSGIKTTPLINNNKFTPFKFGLKYHKKKDAEYYYKLSKDRNLPVMKWPDLPPEVINNIQSHHIANNLYNTNLFFPVHQTLEYSALKKIGDIFQNNEDNNNCYNLIFENIDSIKWVDFLKHAKNPNLMQSWGYGEAKKNIWTIKRGMITYKKQPIAIFQALEKQWGPIGIIRINRGPLILGVADTTTKYFIYKTLRKLSFLKNSRIISVAPNLNDTEENMAIMQLAGYKKRKKNSLRSILINLNQSEDQLRKGLNGKWRNQLKKSENDGLQLEIGDSEVLHIWLMGKYKELMEKKSFVGPKIELYNDLHKFDKKSSIILQAWYKSSVVAGILISKHGNSCCYQVGWNSFEGRKINANNFLLWNAIVEMKKQGYTSFDLGGINEDLTPGITKFKRGLGGDEYQLVGEWLSF
jgi:hypothetical protein